MVRQAPKFSHAGVGAGALVISITTRLTIERISLRVAFFINAGITLVLQVPAIFMYRTRASHAAAKLAPMELKWMVHPGARWVFGWAFLSMLGNQIALFSLATYSTQGLGLSQTKGANLQAIMAGGMIAGRPAIGLLLDRYGRLNMTILLTWIAGMTCLVIWMFSRTFGLMVFFAFVHGMVGGTIWTAATPVCADMTSMQHLGSLLSIFWLSIVPPTLVAEAIAVALINYSKTSLGRHGADAFLISIGFAGGCFVFSAMILCGARRWKLGSWKVFVKV